MNFIHYTYPDLHAAVGRIIFSIKITAYLMRCLPDPRVVETEIVLLGKGFEGPTFLPG